MFETIQQSIKEFQVLQEALANIISRLILFLPKLIAAFFAFILFWLFYRIIRLFLNRYFKKADISVSLVHLINKVLKYFSLGLAMLFVADQLDIKIVALLSTLGVAGVAIGLAAHQTMANFISGIIILVSKPFRENDYVELEGEFGKVDKISLRSTTILTLDNLSVDIPNQKITESKVINHTFNRHIRLRIEVGIAYKEYIPEAQKVLLDIVKDDNRLLNKPAPEVVVDAIADSSINLHLLVWLKDSRQEVPIKYDLNQKVKLALDAANIQIPFPHQQVFIDDINTKNIEGLIKSDTTHLNS